MTKPNQDCLKNKERNEIYELIIFIPHPDLLESNIEPLEANPVYACLINNDIYDLMEFPF